MYRVAKGILKNDADCADAIQEAIIKSYLAIRQLRDSQVFKAWITRIVINQCYDLLKKQRKIILMEAVEIEEKMDVPKDYYELSEAMDQLNKEHRIVVALFYYEQFSIEEIAGILDVKEGTVKSRLNRARQKLAELLQLDDRKRGEHHGL